MGLDFMALRMAVLVQRVVPARYAFVIHTTNPSTGALDISACEQVWSAERSLFDAAAEQGEQIRLEGTTPPTRQHDPQATQTLRNLLKCINACIRKAASSTNFAGDESEVYCELV